MDKDTKTPNELALALSKIGWKVFPCNPNKAPMTRKGFHAATTDNNQIEQWWSRNPKALVGIACEKSGIWAVDVDNKNGLNGEAVLLELIKSNGGTLPDCPTQTTPTGGKHFIFKYPEIGEINNATNQLGEGLDTRSKGYICTGEGYSWVSGLSPIENDTPYAPEWIVALAAKKHEPLTKVHENPLLDLGDVGEYWLQKATKKSRVGIRNETGLWLACQLRDNGLSKNEARYVMYTYQRKVTTTENPYSRKEVLASLNNAYSKPSRKPAKKVGGDMDREEPRYKLYSAKDALSPQPPINWIVENLIAEGTVSVLFGDAGSKKTYAMIDLAVCVAIGKKWLNFSTKQGSVLYVDEEMGARHISIRISETIRGHGGDENSPFFFTAIENFDLRKSEDKKKFRQLLIETKPQLVIIDALMDVLPGADENSVKDVLPVLKELKRIADLVGIAIIAIHHANKGGNYRGTSAIKGGVDLLLKVESKQGNLMINFDTEKPRLILSTKFSAKAVWDEGMFYLEPSEEKSGSSIILKKPEKYVLSYLAYNEPASVGVIKSNAETVSSESARQAVYSLSRRELLIRENSGQQGVSAIYKLTEPGRKLAYSLDEVDEGEILMKQLRA